MTSARIGSAISHNALRPGELATTAAVALLFARERGEEAGYAEVALADAAAAFAAPLRHGATVQGGPLGGGLPQYGLYPSRTSRDGWPLSSASTS